MKPFIYKRARSLDEAISEVASASQTTLLAGGTNLLDLMKERLELPDALVDISRLPLATIVRTANGGLSLGALATNADTADHAVVKEQYPLISKAILAGASPQIRNKATNGGNLMQRTRCPYFYDLDSPCNKRQAGSGCGALSGYQRLHAILGSSPHCIATHPSDLCVALAALDAVVVVVGPHGERRIAFPDFHRLPGEEPQRDNVLGPDEIITAIEVPPEGYSLHHAYLKIRDRRSYAFALVSVAAGLTIEDGVITAARIALGGVAHKPWRKQEAEKLLEGKRPSDDLFRKVSHAMLEGARGFGGNDFKIPMAGRAVVRALAESCNLQLQQA
jgi:xanthine dehydrogenase YagS FAD-binding subunit